MTEDSSGLLAEIAFAHQLADLARPIARRHFRQALPVDTKADASPVTRADREIEARLREAIRTRHPSHGILGEEQAPEGLDRRHVWVIDPIDGTKSFITGMPLFGTLIALVADGKPVLGLVDMPILDERWVGAPGLGATHNSTPCRTREVAHLGDAVVMTTSPDAYDPRSWAAFEAMSRRARLRRFGGDCYMYALLASGHVDVVTGCRLEPYDYLPMVALVEAAGGCITDWQGRALGLSGGDGRVAVSANATLHAQVLAALNDRG